MFAEGVTRRVEAFMVRGQKRGTEEEMLPSGTLLEFTVIWFQRDISVILMLNQQWRDIAVKLHRLWLMIRVHPLLLLTTKSMFTARPNVTLET